MKRTLFGAILLGLAVSVPVPAMAGVSVQIGIPLPPPIVVAAPPAVVLLPHTGVYVAPDLAADLFFFDGWWWRSWEGRWYRARHYRSGWAHYNGIPSFHGRVPAGWRDDYRAHRWHGQEWRYERVSHRDLQKIHQRNYREQSRRQHFRAERPHSQGKSLTREAGRSQHGRTQQSRSPHGGPEGRR